MAQPLPQTVQPAARNTPNDPKTSDILSQVSADFQPVVSARFPRTRDFWNNWRLAGLLVQAKDAFSRRSADGVESRLRQSKSRSRPELPHRAR